MQYLVSIRLMTYNHQEYIAKCLDHILEQQTNFKVEVVIGDDFSTDKTLEIIKKYQSTENIRLRILDRKIGDEYYIKRKRLGRLYNFVDIINHCTGKYIALIDGDDYWIDPLKLQKQVDFLEANPDFVMVFTNTLIKDEDKNVQRVGKQLTVWDIATTEELLSHNNLNIKYPEIGSPGHVSSLLFRNFLLGDFPLWYYNLNVGDEPLFLMLSKFGKAKFINEVTGVYRIHSEGLSTSGFSYIVFFKERIKMYKYVNVFLEKKFHQHSVSLIIRYNNKLIRQYFNKKMFGLAAVTYFENIYYKLIKGVEAA
jgi:glycosyltransferase involved in cell wall biosynthesis